MENLKVHFSSKTDMHSTPIAFFEELDKEFNFTLDPCATKENTKCKKFFTKKQNGLLKNWNNEHVFMNPPYGREIKHWVKKASETRGGGSCLSFTSKNRYGMVSRSYI